MGIHLRCKLIHFNPAVQLQKLCIPVIQRLDTVQHVIHLISYLGKLIVRIHLNPMIIVSFTDNSDFTDQPFNRCRIIFCHGFRHPPGYPIPGSPHYEQCAQTDIYGFVSGIIYQRINDCRKFRQFLRHDPVSGLSMGPAPMPGSVKFITAVCQTRFADIHDILSEIGNHSVKVAFRQIKVPPASG